MSQVDPMREALLQTALYSSGTLVCNLGSTYVVKVDPQVPEGPRLPFVTEQPKRKILLED